MHESSDALSCLYIRQERPVPPFYYLIGTRSYSLLPYPNWENTLWSRNNRGLLPIMVAIFRQTITAHLCLATCVIWYHQPFQNEDPQLYSESQPEGLSDDSEGYSAKTLGDDFQLPKNKRRRSFVAPIQTASAGNQTQQPIVQDSESPSVPQMDGTGRDPRQLHKHG